MSSKLRMKHKRITVMSWKDDNDKLPVIVNIKDNPSSYNKDENAKQLARLLMLTMPGSTLDEIFTSIANDIRQMIDNPYGGIRLLKEPYDIENRIRGVLTNLAKLSEIEDTTNEH